jgi:hypothetical protein
METSTTSIQMVNTTSPAVYYGRGLSGFDENAAK